MTGTQAPPPSLSRLKALLSGAPEVTGNLIRAELFQVLVSRGRYDEAFAQAEAMVDAGLRLGDLRLFWHPWSARDVGSISDTDRDALRRLSAQGAHRIWAAYCLALLECRFEPMAPLAGLLRGRRYGWMCSRLGRLSLDEGRWERALRLLRAGVRLRPDEWRHRFSLAEGLLCVGQRSAALEQARLAVDMARPEDRMEALAWQGQILLWMGRYRQALRVLQAAEAGGAVWATGWLGGALVKLERYEEASTCLQKALSRYPHDTEATLWLGECLLALDRCDEGLRVLSALPADSTFASVLRVLLKRRGGDAAWKEDAERVSRNVYALAAPRRRRRVDELRAETGADRIRALETVLRRARGFRANCFAGTILDSR